MSYEPLCLPCFLGFRYPAAAFLSIQHRLKGISDADKGHLRCRDIFSRDKVFRGVLESERKAVCC